MTRELAATSFFLVERYLPVPDLDALFEAVARVELACSDCDTGARYLHATYLPDDDTCFCVFQARSAHAVRAVNETGRFNLDRIIPAIALHPTAGRVRPTTNVPAADPQARQR